MVSGCGAAHYGHRGLTWFVYFEATLCWDSVMLRVGGEAGRRGRKAIHCEERS